MSAPTRSGRPAAKAKPMYDENALAHTCARSISSASSSRSRSFAQTSTEYGPSRPDGPKPRGSQVTSR